MGPCQFEMRRFVECAQNQGDITLCQGFNEALRQCKLANGEKCLLKFDERDTCIPDRLQNSLFVSLTIYSR